MKSFQLAAGKNTQPMLAVLKQVSPAEKLARARASKALSNARQRCNNPKNPDYPQYGAVGVAVTIKNLEELMSEIGLPKAGESLDRIDPNGHYDLANVRWATAAVQSANKKLASMNVKLSEADQITTAKVALELQRNRAGTAFAWTRMRQAFLRGYLTAADAEFFAESHFCAGALESSFDVTTIPDLANEEPAYLHLPALSMPNQRVRLMGSPADPPENARYLDKHGRWSVLEQVHHSWNIPEIVWERIAAAVDNSQSGLTVTGRPTPNSLLGGWIEGAFLAAASCLPRETGASAAFRPLPTLLEDLKDLSPQWEWDYVEHPILDADALLVPDLVVDVGEWSNHLKNQMWRVNQLLEYRYDQAKTTIVGVQNVSKLHPAVRNLVLGAFSTLKMPHADRHARSKLQFGEGRYRLQDGTLCLGSFALDMRTAPLVKAPPHILA
jgi:hypothetical protein